MKRLLAILLSLTLMLSLVPTAWADEESTSPTSGYCGGEKNEENVRWALTANGGKVTVSNEEKDTYTLTISGSGAMKNYAQNQNSGELAPWKTYYAQITRVEIGEGVTNIGSNAFRNAYGAYTFSLSSTVETIGEDALLHCWIDAFEVAANSPYFKQVDGVLFSADETKLVCYPTNKTQDSYTVPNGVIEIADYAFANPFHLKMITFPDTLKTIGKCAFRGHSMPSIHIDSNSITEIKALAFADEWGSCKTALTEIYLDIPNLTTLGGTEGSIIAGATGITTAYLNIPNIPDKFLSARGDVSKLTSLTLGPDVKQIGSEAFHSQSSIRVLDMSGINKGLTIGHDAFNSCSGLVAVLMPNGLNSVGTGAFTAGTTFYFDNATDLGKLTSTQQSYVKKDSILAVTNGGTFADNTTFESGKFATPTKAGFTFKGWYEDADFTGDPVTTPENGKTYYAKWEAHTLSEITVAPKENAKFTYGSTLGSSDFVVTAVYDNGETVTVDPKNYKVSPDTALTTVGENTVTVTVTYLGKTATCKITVAKATQAAPAAPTLKDRTYTSITLNEVADAENGAKAEYSKDGGTTWKASPEFTDLTSGTTYTFAVRYAETDTYAASDASATAEFSTLYRSSGGSSSSGSSYAVSTPSTKNGDVTVNSKNAKKGDTVTITVTPDKGYELDTITVKDASGNKLKLTDKGNGKYTFTMPASKVTVSADFAEIQAASTFADVPADAYYAKAVEWAVKNGITNGKDNGLFGSNDPCTRGQIVTFLWRAAGSPAPKGTATVPADVLPGSYSYNAVAWALENGITNGLADGTFGVNNTCTRGQSVTFLYRTMGTAPSTVNGFTDVAADSFCAGAVAWAVENGVTNGTSATTFSPADGCTRAQIVTFLYRAYQGK